MRKKVCQLVEVPVLRLRLLVGLLDAAHLRVTSRQLTPRNPAHQNLTAPGETRRFAHWVG